jgi:hypothetical protein
MLSLVTVLGLAACGDDDDGSSVRDIDGDCDPSAASGSGSGSGSASESESESGSGSESGSASGSASECEEPSGSGSGSESASEPASGAAAEGECIFEGESDAEATESVELTLTEYAIEADTTEVAAGSIEFSAVNDGAEDHEVVIVQFDGDPAELPVDDDGNADEEQLPEGAVIGEIEGFAAGGTCAATFDLEPGEYVLLCNIFEEEEHEAHFEEGMLTSFTVS